MKKLRKLNITKATGYDGLSIELIKIAATKLVTSLTRMINICINDCVFPDSLKMANVPQYLKLRMNLQRKIIDQSVFYVFFHRFLNVF